MAAERALYPFQEQGVRALVGRPAVLLADEMGLGKTVQAATALARLAARGELTRALVIAPRGLLTQWRTALEEWAPALSAIRVEGSTQERAWRWRAAKHVFLTGYESARNDLGVLRARPWDVVILDEAQRIKNRDAETSRALKRLPRLRSWALTGTPLENRADELASILEFVAPNASGDRLPTLRHGLGLAQRQAEVQLRRRKRDVLSDLPPKTVIRVPLHLGAGQRRTYDRIEDAAHTRLRSLGDRATVMNALEAIGRLKQACNFCPESGDSAKHDDLGERMEEIAASGHRALVFSQWTNDRFGVARIAAGLTRFRPLVFTGALDSAERDGAVRRFFDDSSRKVLVLSLRAGGQGLNLQAASYVVHFDRWWNPAVEDQATDRSHRAGQEHPVTVYEYVCENTIEERIEQILDGKRALFRGLVDGVSMDLARTLSPEQIFGLFGLPAPRHLRVSDREGTALARAEAMLEDAGWVLIAGDPPLSDLTAERVDELGRRSRLCIALAHGGDDRERLVELAEVVCSDVAARGVLILTDEASDEFRSLAELRSVELWHLPPAGDRSDVPVR